MLQYRIPFAYSTLIRKLRVTRLMCLRRRAASFPTSLAHLALIAVILLLIFNISVHLYSIFFALLRCFLKVSTLSAMSFFWTHSSRILRIRRPATKQLFKEILSFRLWLRVSLLLFGFSLFLWFLIWILFIVLK